MFKKKKKTALVLKIANGRVEEYENGSVRLSYGSNIIAAATDLSVALVAG